MSFPLFTDLDSDWCAVAASQRARDALERWGDDPILGGARSLDDLLARTGKGGDPGDADAVLRALMSRASTDEIAARTVLQSVIPGLVSVARRVGARENPDLEAEVATVAWTAIRGEKLLQRRGSIAGQLLLDVFHVVSRLRRGNQEQPVPPGGPRPLRPQRSRNTVPAVQTGERSWSSWPVPGRSRQSNCASSATPSSTAFRCRSPPARPGCRSRP